MSIPRRSHRSHTLAKLERCHCADCHFEWLTREPDDDPHGCLRCNCTTITRTDFDTVPSHGHAQKAAVLILVPGEL